MSNYKVRLVPVTSLKYGNTGSISDSQVTFEVTPQFTEDRAADYNAVTPVHMPGSIQMYRSTSSRTFNLTATLISRNGEDALKNRQRLQMLRGWLMPYFGSTDTLTEQNRTIRKQNAGFSITDQTLPPEQQAEQARSRIQAEGVQLRGAPPDVLYLYAYSTGSDQMSGTRMYPTYNINRVPVVLSSLNITYPDDVDYIPVDNGEWIIEPFPVKMSVNLQLLETHSPREFERFDLAAYKAGTLANF